MNPPPTVPVEERLAELAPVIKRIARKWGMRLYGYGQYTDDLYSEGMIAAWTVLQKDPDAESGDLISAAQFRIRGHVHSITNPGAPNRKAWTGKPRANAFENLNPGSYSLDELRDVLSDRMYADAVEDPDVSLAYHRAEIERAIDELPPECGAVLRATADGWKMAEYVRAIGGNYDAERYRLHRARRDLSAKLAHLRDAA